MSKTRHVSVLAEEVLEWLRAGTPGLFFDGTFGGGGHTKLVLLKNPQNTVHACDRDKRALERGEDLKKEFAPRLTLHHTSFGKAFDELDDLQFDGMLLDLGLSTDQLFEERGFSFRDSTPLDMRMDESASKTAAEIVNESSENELKRILKVGGVGKEMRWVLPTILRERPFQTAKELADAIASGTPARERGDSHPATVVFQALRIAVNQEFDELRSFLEKAPEHAKPEGRLAIISFHSLEDEMVTKTMRKWEQGGETAPAWYPGAREARNSKGKLLTKKAVVPTEEEVSQNPASRSARMRVFEFKSKSSSNEIRGAA